jgi:hypothetical protein
MEALRVKRLSTEEVVFLLTLITGHREYYGMLVGHTKCSEASRGSYERIEELARKLEAMR